MAPPSQELEPPINPGRFTLAFARARDAAYNAVYALWLRRKAEGMTQKDIGVKLDRDAARISKHLAGPGNWTLRTLGEMVEALDGIVAIAAYPAEEFERKNYDIYEDIGHPEPRFVEPLCTFVESDSQTVFINRLCSPSKIIVRNFVSHHVSDE